MYRNIVFFPEALRDLSGVLESFFCPPIMLHVVNQLHWNASKKKKHETNLHQASEMLQHTFHGELQQVVVSQVEASQVHSGKHAQRKTPEEVGV